MLLTLVALGLMAAIAVKAVDGQEKDRQGTSALLQQLAEQGQTQADMSSGAQPSAAGPAGPGGMMGAASVTACSANVDLVEKALATMSATGQDLPFTIEELVARGGLTEVPSMRGYTLTLENVDGQPTGKVLVNGKLGAQGCVTG